MNKVLYGGFEYSDGCFRIACGSRSEESTEKRKVGSLCLNIYSQIDRDSRCDPDHACDYLFPGTDYVGDIWCPGTFFVQQFPPAFAESGFGNRDVSLLREK